MQCAEYTTFPRCSQADLYAVGPLDAEVWKKGDGVEPGLRACGWPSAVSRWKGAVEPWGETWLVDSRLWNFIEYHHRTAQHLHTSP